MTSKKEKVDLEVVAADLTHTAAELGKLLSKQPKIFDRGGPARIAFDIQRNGFVVELLSVNGVVNECHQIAQPYKIRMKGDAQYREGVTLPERVANLYLDQKDQWNLRPLNGISCCPLLSDNGSIRTAEGYDPVTKLWCENIPEIQIQEMPSGDDAEKALLLLRKTFRTFAFADADKIYDPVLGVNVVDLSRPPKEDESAMLSAILTAVCRPSLWLSPAIVICAPSFSGAGTGKGLLARAVSALAFGTSPQAITAGGNAEEFDKRISAALIGASETLFLDNMNGAVLKSDVLASVLTERPCQVRVLGKSKMLPLNASTLVLITGNGLTLSEDMVRRCLLIELDAGLEDPEQRPFKNNLVQDILANRGDLLKAALTIWRWGRVSGETIRVGRPLGSYDDWARWVRDPLLTLGCCDPVARMALNKANDPRRQNIVEIFDAWWAAHENNPVKVSDLSPEVKAIVDPQNRGRQNLVSKIRKLDGTRAAGFVLTRKSPDGRWTADTYQLFRTSTEHEVKIVGDHRGQQAELIPMTPMTPDVSDAGYYDEDAEEIPFD